MPLTGVTALRRNLEQTFTDIREGKAKEFVTAVLSIAWNESKLYTPIEYSNLINSVTMNIEVTGSITSGTLTYNANYAAALEFRENWKPRPPSEKSGQAWNPNATPHYLQKGFESPDSVNAINKAKEIFKI